jgi:hypothetical protein
VLRTDLLALTPEDLAALSNRGLTNRALKECADGKHTAQWEEDGEDGTIRATWSDGPVCTLPGGGTLKDGQCSCAAAGLCRHILRTVLAWQRRHAPDSAAGAPHPSPPDAAPWNPGQLNDAAMRRQVARSVLTRASRLWSGGVLAELLCGAKPSAHFHCPGHTVRFMVRNDLRYTKCSCGQEAPCVHAVLGVRAFRLLEPGATSGIVSAGTADATVPPELLGAAQGCVRDLLADGLASLGGPWRDRVRRAAADCSGAALTWPAQILEELASDLERYIARDAAFTPAETVERAGELLLRLDAIRASSAPVPQAFIRGMAGDRDCDLGHARMIGLGATVTESRRSTRLTVFLQCTDTGHVMTVMSEHTHDPGTPDTHKAFHELAKAPAVKDATMAMLAAGQLMTHGGRRTASGRLSLRHALCGVTPQSFKWEELKAPALVEDFGELAARLRLLPPASFRPRREAADFHVCPLSGVQHAGFDPATNGIAAVLHDTSGGTARLLHPWTSRGERGAEALLAALRAEGAPRFIAGHVRAAGDHLVIRPTALVLEEGGSRRMVLPWIDDAARAAAAPDGARPLATAGHGLARYAPAAELAADLILNGLGRSRARGWPGWERSITETEAQGYHRMASQLRRVRASADPAVALDVLKLLALARDLA